MCVTHSFLSFSPSIKSRKCITTFEAIKWNKFTISYLVSPADFGPSLKLISSIETTLSFLLTISDLFYWIYSLCSHSNWLSFIHLFIVFVVGIIVWFKCIKECVNYYIAIFKVKLKVLKVNGKIDLFWKNGKNIRDCIFCLIGGILNPWIYSNIGISS